MPTVDVVSLENKKVGTLKLDDSVFATRVNIPLVQQCLNAQRAGMRQGTVKTKTRAEVRATNKKPYKQKGTGNARRGSSVSPLLVGGGVTFGPRPRDWKQSTPKKMNDGALRSLLTDRLESKRLVVVDTLDLKEPKTKSFANRLKKFKFNKVLVVGKDTSEKKKSNIHLAGRNIKNVHVLTASTINVYDLLKHDWLMLSKEAAESLQKRLAFQSKRSSQKGTKGAKA